MDDRVAREELRLIHRYLNGDLEGRSLADFYERLRASSEMREELARLASDDVLVAEILQEERALAPPLRGSDSGGRRTEAMKRAMALSGRRTRRRRSRPGRAFWIGLAACATVAAGIYVASGRRRAAPAGRDLVAHVLGASEGVTVRRNGRTHEAAAGMRLFVGDCLGTERGAVATVAYAGERTRLELAPETELALLAGERGKRLEVVRGRIEARVAPQPVACPVVITSKDARAEVLGTRLSLKVTENATRFEVAEGRVRLTSAHDGTSIELNSGHFAVAAAGVALAAEASPSDWPQLGRNPQRWDYSPETIPLPYKVKWSYDLRAKIDPIHHTYPAAQVIVAAGKAFVGTRGGTLFAFDAVNGGDPVWRFEAGGPIEHTAGYEDGKVFFAAMDGCVYALNAATHGLEWKFDIRARYRRRFGFSAAVLLAEDRVFVADRGGWLYALNQSDGAEAWGQPYEAGAPVFQSAAYNTVDGQGRVYFTGEDMRVHAVNAATGGRVWRLDPPLGAMGFVDYWPVVVKGKIVLMSGHGSEHRNVPDTIFVVDERTGEVLSGTPQTTMSMHSVLHPAVVWGSATGNKRLVIPWHTSGLESFGRGWALWNLDTNGIQELAGAMEGAQDEVLAHSVIGDVFLVEHSNAWGNSRANQTGAYDLVSGARQNGLPCGGNGNLENNSQCGGASAVVAANGLLYNQCVHTVYCLESQ